MRCLVWLLEPGQISPVLLVPSPPQARRDDGRKSSDADPDHMFGHRYERGNPNLTNPRAPIPVTVTLRFDPGVVTGGAEGESHGGNGYGIQVLQNGVPVVLSKEIVLLPSGPVVPQALPLPPEPPPLCPPVEPLPMFGGDQRSVRAARARETVCAEARKSPSQRGEWRFGKPPPDAQAALPEAHEWLISPATVADVPLAGLSFGRPRHRVYQNA